MARSFNTTGPCIPGEHYMLPPESRCPGVRDPIEANHFFVMHAPRQSGKTTLLKALARELNMGGRYHALYCSLETVQGFVEPERGIPAVIRSLGWAVKYHPALKAHPFAEGVPPEDVNNGLRLALTNLCANLDRPLVLFLDEADCLGGGTLITFLRQLRDGYVNRGDIPFLHSLALVGMRNIRDYKAQVRPDSDTLGSASPFNIAKTALTIGCFSRAEVEALYQQHTEDTGQAFPADLVDRVVELTQGQPWLVNAIAAEIVEKLAQRDVTRPLTASMVDDAAERMILRRDTHIDSLLERLKEERVRRIIEPVLLGEGDDIRESSDDYQYVRDLGLIRNDRGVIRIANPLYAEVIARTLNHDMQNRLAPEFIHRWMDASGIDMNGLLKGFQEFWRDHSEAWRRRFEYQEAAPHLILLAFLQRVVNGGAKITREFATGTQRVDVCVEYGDRRYPIELKLVRGQRTREEGLKQLGGYMDRLGCKEGWLLLFDVEARSPWEQRLTWETLEHEGGAVHVVGC